MSTYLDTHIAAWLAFRETHKLSGEAKAFIQKGSLLISPMVLIELEILFEIRRIRFGSAEVHAKLSNELGVEVCSMTFEKVAFQASREGWTRDPFDRIIVAQARANGMARLISADEDIRKHYEQTVW